MVCCRRRRSRPGRRPRSCVRLQRGKTAGNGGRRQGRGSGPVVEHGVSGRVYDAVVVGGGPAGLSAAIYLARFRRVTLVVDGGTGRSAGPQRNENYLGFPRGVTAARLRTLGRQQAERFGARIVGGT